MEPRGAFDGTRTAAETTSADDGITAARRRPALLARPREREIARSYPMRRKIPTVNVAVAITVPTIHRTSLVPRFGGWVALKKADLETLPVPDVRTFSASQQQQLLNLFDRSAECDFEPLPGMLSCPARKALDDGVSTVLGLRGLETLRALLASEPVVSNARL